MSEHRVEVFTVGNWSTAMLTWGWGCLGCAEQVYGFGSRVDAQMDANRHVASQSPLAVGDAASPAASGLHVAPVQGREDLDRGGDPA